MRRKSKEYLYSEDETVLNSPRLIEHIHSLENQDADGNRGTYMDFYLCPNCGSSYITNNKCDDCGQLVFFKCVEGEVWEEEDIW